MRLGMMNDPRKDACEELRWAADNGFEFFDLTIEGPGADLEHLNVPALRSLLDTTGLGLVGHTAWYLPFASPFAPVRQAAVACVAETFEAFAHLGAQWVNVHITFAPKFFSREQRIAWNAESFAALAKQSTDYGLRIMVEHPPDASTTVADIRHILDADARLGFHLDVGHANIGGDKLEGLLRAFKTRLAHVHLSDNLGRSDDHLMIGAGSIDWPRAIRLIRETGYDNTVTLEVFTPDRDYLLLSARKVRDMWERAGQDMVAAQSSNSAPTNPEA